MITPVSDFTFYWVAAERFVSNANPYAADPAHGLIMLAPPWILPLIAPLGWLPLSTAESLWHLLSLLALGIAGIWLWQLYAEGSRPIWGGLLIAFFAPVVANLVTGQMAMIMLFGLAGFLRYQARRPYLAGAFLFLVGIKPQVAFLIWPALLLCAWRLGRWENLRGFVTMFLVACYLAWDVWPSVFTDYWQAYQVHHADFYETAALGRSSSALFLLLFVALGWLACRWHGASRWDWKAEAPGLLLVSILASPHVWFADQVLLIPALFDAAAGLRRMPYRIAFAATYAGVNVALLVSMFALHRMFWYSSIIFVWIGFFALAKASARPGTSVTLPSAPPSWHTLSV